MTATLFDRLREEWRDDLGSWGATAAEVDAAYEETAARYGEAHRSYHTLDHVASVLRTADGLAADVGIADRRPIRLAAWYHDVVYDPQASDNEARSAVIATAELVSLSVPPDVAQECARLIGLTAGHVVAPGDRAGSVLLDADLAILSASPDRYRAYAEKVRAEYSHLDDATYAFGRVAVLQRFLAGPFIYATPSFRAERDARARANLEHELAVLQGG